MNLYQLLHDHSEEIVGRATADLGRHHHTGYLRAGGPHTHQRLKALYVLTSRAVKEKNLGPMIAHVESLARERCSAGDNLRELQTAFNVLEETIWRQLLIEVPPEELGEALGLVTTALSAGKNALARTYVSMACPANVPKLNLEYLFTGVS